ncbi:MAG TPA: class I tRNA ligase family protein, partial [Candidatus Dormibacteraeota bacterium]
MSKYYVTTSIVYINNTPHLGYIYELVGTDVLARYHRMIGDETFFLTGSDEHSQNVQRRAQEEGVTTAEYTGRMAEVYRQIESRFGISYDRFIRTEDADHVRGVQALISKIQARGDIYKGAYEGWYCVSCEAFKQEKDLVDGLCPIHRTTPDWIREKNYFFRLSKYAEPLRQHFTDHPGFLVPDVRRNEILRLIEGGLDDISVSRAGQAWGI